jgi:pimeloyl-ACP methyl ester carboxylesterase
VREIPHHLYPFEHHYLVLDGLRYHYLDEGAGSPVVMVHGNPTWSIYYRNLVTSLRGTHRCVVPDHIGCGYSDKPSDARYPYTLSRRVDDLARLIDHLGLETIDLVVHDWGGMIGMTWAVRNPQRVRRIVLLNTSAFHLPATKPLPWQLWLTRTFVGALMVRGGNAFSAAATYAACTRAPMSPELRRAYTAPYDSWANRIATLRFVQDIPLEPGDPGYDLVTEVAESLHRLRDKPTLIGWGDRDFVFDHHFLAQWRTYLPDAEVHQFANCGHYVLEDAWAELEPLIQRHLALPVGATKAAGPA